MTTYATKQSDIKRGWHLIDLKDKILGRVASRITEDLIGKNKVYYAPNLDCGDYVVAINADKIKVSGKKRKQKSYYRHSGYPGGLKALTFEQVMAKDPKKVMMLAVKNMLPKNKLRARRMKRLKVFVGAEHPYSQKLKVKN